jgi:hypothetical protein
VVSTDAVVSAEADGILRDALTCIQAVMHASPTRTMIRLNSITVVLDPSATKGFTKRFMDRLRPGEPYLGLLKLWVAPRPPDPLRAAPTC